jgi:GrpB-like predicted nucleotidyltransferase (UPF0157 family)
MSIITIYQRPDFKYRPFDPATRTVFRKVKRAICDACAPVKVEHIGSTAFGAGGKNLVDMLLVYEKGAKTATVKALRGLGFQNERHKPTDRTTTLLLGSYNHRAKTYSVHVHLATPDMIVSKRMPFFRDYMRDHPELVRKYDALKREAQRRGIKENKPYNKFKESIILKVLKEMDSSP